jgi:hypothetical protein
MFAIHATYRGHSRRRGDYVREIAEALAGSRAVTDVSILTPEEFALTAPDADSATTVVLNLLQAGDFAVGIGAVLPDPDDEDADPAPDHLTAAAERALVGNRRPGVVSARIEQPGPGGVQAPGHAVDVADDIAAAFTLIAHLLSRRTAEGREATALMRQGYLQTEAAEMVGISKQAMSQRLAAAGWQAEQAGWTLAVHMLARVGTLR